MIEILLGKIKRNWEFILASFLWLCVWGGYATDLSRFFNPGFPQNVLDLIHGLRSLLPFLALIISIIILFKRRLLSKKIFATPLGLLLIFTIIGLISSIFSKDPLWAFYWGILYGIVIIVLLAVIENKDLLKNIIKINWIIAGILAVGLTLFLLVQPGVVKSLTFNFLICSQRPYEGLGGVPAGIDTFGIMGTRPTGLGRYAGVAAVIALAGFLCAQNKTKKKTIWAIPLILFSLILFFSKGRADIIGFLIVAIFLLWITKKINKKTIFLFLVVSAIEIVSIFYNIPCSNNINIVSFIAPKHTAITQSPKRNPELQIKESAPANGGSGLKVNGHISTLSGRTIIWQDAWHLFLGNPLFGYGFQADRIMLDGRNAQNSLVQALLEAGVLGTVPFIFAFILILLYLSRLFKNPRIEGDERNFLIALSAILAFFAINSATESAAAVFQPDWFFVAPIIAYIQCLYKEKNAEDGYKKNYVNFLGNRISAMTSGEVVKKIGYWIKNEPRKLHWIVGKDMHGAVGAERHADFKYILNSVDLFLPDGIPLVWLLRLKGFDAKKRVSGIDLMINFFPAAENEGFSNYFYGDTEDTLKKLDKRLSEKFPNLKIAGSYSPPFRELTEKEDEEIIEKINQEKPDVLWVGLGLPKQERWIFEHKDRLNVPVVMGVGAAFKFLSGDIKRAPKWIGDWGFEWLWRFFQEPKRMWKRVFIDMPFFFWLVFKDLLFENNQKI